MARIPWLSYVRSLCPVLSIIAHVAFRYSFAYATMGHRLPTILGKAIDDVFETLNQESEEDRVKDLIECIERMDELKRDLEEHAKLRPVVDDGEADVALWNKEIAKYFQGKLTSSRQEKLLYVLGGFRVVMTAVSSLGSQLRFSSDCAHKPPCVLQAKTS